MSFFEETVEVRAVRTLKTKLFQFVNDMLACAMLCRSRNLIPVTYVFESAPISLFWFPGDNELLEMCFECLFNLIPKSTLAFLTGQS